MDYNLRIALSCASDGKPSRTDTLLKKKHFWTSSSSNHETIFVEEIPWRAKHEFKLKRNLVKKCHWVSLQNEHCSWPRSTVNAEITKWMSACAFYWTCIYIYVVVLTIFLIFFISAGECRRPLQLNSHLLLSGPAFQNLLRVFLLHFDHLGDLVYELLLQVQEFVWRNINQSLQRSCL